MQSLKHPLHEKALFLAEELKSKEAELLEVLIEMRQKKLLMPLGYRSVFEYVVQGLKLSEAQAFYFQKVVEKSFEVPELKEAIVTGKLSLSKARRIVPVLNKENQELWIAKASELNQRELEKAVAIENPRSQIREQLKPVGEQVLQMIVAITPEVEELLKQVKALESQRTHSAAGWNESLKAMANLYLDKHDPVRKAKRNLSSKSNIFKSTASNNTEPKPEKALPLQKSFLRKQNARFISASVRHQVHQRDQHQCVARTPQGTRCEQKQWLELDHMIPVAQGGISSVHNLRTLCHFHHRVRHMG